MIIDATDNNLYGLPGFSPAAFQGDVYQWSWNLQKAWIASASTLSHVADLLVSDAGRLTAALALVNTSGVDGVCADDLSTKCTPPASCGDAPCLPGWGLDTESQTALTEAMQRSLTRFMWWTMLPVPVLVTVCPGGVTNPHDCSGVCPPFVPEGALQVNWVQQAQTGYDVASTSLYFSINTGEQQGFFLDAGTLQTLFDQPSPSAPDNLGFQKAYFFGQAFANADGIATSPGFVFYTCGPDQPCVPRYYCKF
jgi:hypothetical protein